LNSYSRGGNLSKKTTKSLGWKHYVPKIKPRGTFFSACREKAVKTRVDAISRRLWNSLDLEAGRIGQTIHQYTIRNVVDGGGMGIVYQAWDMRLNRMVALKFLRQADLEGILMARLGRIEDALRTANQLEPTSPTLAAAIHLELGQTEWALSQLEYAVEIRDAYLTSIKAWPGTDPVREHPRFKTVLERMNLHGE